MIGNLYAVGDPGLSAYLATSEEGHILINTGSADSTPWMRKNIASLGFDIRDVKVLTIGSLNRICPGFQKYLDWFFWRKEARGVVFRWRMVNV